MTDCVLDLCVAITSAAMVLTHWGRVMHICVSKLTFIGSDNGLSPDRRQAIIWTNDGLLLIGPLGTNFSEILIKIIIFSWKKMRLKVSSAKWRPFCLGLNELTMRDKSVPTFHEEGYQLLAPPRSWEMIDGLVVRNVWIQGDRLTESGMFH